jgi:pimeloyl-ACP methyl ester carboxylesterase
MPFIRAHHDIVLIDQRGTGRSNPLDCDSYGNPPDLQRVVTSSFPLDVIRACRERLDKIADLRLYTTAIGMDDIDEVRDWLGYQKINLTGGSYGSLAAQVYLRSHAQHVRVAARQGIVLPTSCTLCTPPGPASAPQISFSINAALTSPVRLRIQISRKISNPPSTASKKALKWKFTPPTAAPPASIPAWKLWPRAFAILCIRATAQISRS